MTVLLQGDAGLVPLSLFVFADSGQVFVEHYSLLSKLSKGGKLVVIMKT